MVEPQQGSTYERLLRLAKHSESLGFDGFFTSDHYLRMGDSDGLPGPTDAWTTLAGLARDTKNIRLGTLVTPITFRHIGSLAIAVSQIDQMSNGRIELGLGAGWFEDEHSALGLPFPSLSERFDVLEDALEIFTGIWKTPIGEHFSFEGREVVLKDSPALPKPTQKPGPPIIMGGVGKKRTPRLVASYAAEYNVPFSSPEEFKALVEIVREACTRIDRNPDDLLYSAAQVICGGADEEDLSRRAAKIGRELDEMKINGLAGNSSELLNKVAQFESKGCDRLYLQILDDSDLEHLSFLSEVLLG